MNNLFLTAGELAADEWRAGRAADEENAEREMRQFVWCLPVLPAKQEQTSLEVHELASRITQLPRGVVPETATELTAAVDIGKYLVHWIAVAWSPGASGHVVDYGRIEVASDDLGVEKAILVALREFKELALGGFPIEGKENSPKQPTQVWVDSGYQAPVVYAFCREAGDRFRPAVGRGAAQQRQQWYNRPTQPGKIAANSASDVVAGTIDLLPTCVRLAGGQAPVEPIIDGRDLSPVLFGKSQESPREAHYYFSGFNLQAVRQGPWKLALVSQSEPSAKGAPGDAEVNPRLYNLDKDIGETTNLADKYPDIVEKLQALATKMNAEIGGQSPSARRPAGVATNPQLLYPVDEPPPSQQNVKPAALAKLRPGDAIRSAAAPQISGKAFTITCQIETQQRDAVILAHGGTAAGYALHLREGRVVFSVRTGPSDAITQVGSEPIKGPVRIVATLAKDGMVTLTAGEQAAVTGKAPSLIPRQPQEDFCLGHDNGQPVAKYSQPQPFKGSITALTVTIP